MSSFEAHKKRRRFNSKEKTTYPKRALYTRRIGQRSPDLINAFRDQNRFGGEGSRRPSLV